MYKKNFHKEIFNSIKFYKPLFFNFSALLFLIVASESIQNSKFIGPDRNQVFQEGDNVSFLEESKEQLASDSGAKSSFKVPPTPLKSNIREQSFQVSISSKF